MTSKVAIFSWQNVGATFLDWSIHWLSGKNNFYNEVDGWGPLTSHPISYQGSNLNAHCHNKNFPRGNQELLRTISKFNLIDSSELLSCYLHLMPIEDALAQVDSSASIDKQFMSAMEISGSDLLECQHTCYEHGLKVVVISLNDPIYNQKVRYIGPQILTTKKTYNSDQDMIDDYLSIFFNPTYQLWSESLGTVNIWDKREFFAINMRPFDMFDLDKHLDFKKETYYIDARELFFNGKETIINLLGYLNLSVDFSRIDHWTTMYLQWQANQARLLKFSWNLDRICRCIVDDLYYDLSSYNLEFWQEAIIQHIMIYKYGLNFKIWQLDRFPANTRDLHALLEPNTINVKNIYGESL